MVLPSSVLQYTWQGRCCVICTDYRQGGNTDMQEEGSGKSPVRAVRANRLKAPSPLGKESRRIIPVGAGRTPVLHPLLCLWLSSLQPASATRLISHAVHLNPEAESNAVLGDIGVSQYDWNSGKKKICFIASLSTQNFVYKSLRNEAPASWMKRHYRIFWTLLWPMF